jgi:hypothetical protein
MGGTQESPAGNNGKHPVPEATADNNVPVYLSGQTRMYLEEGWQLGTTDNQVHPPVPSERQPSDHRVLPTEKAA